MKKILTVIGARPQFIKAATVSRLIQQTQNLTECLVHTGQHYDANMSQIFFDELEIPTPNYNLEIGSGSHGKQTGEMLIALEETMIKEKPDRVMVYGDTNSTLAGALAAAKLHIPVAHVEAGLRSFNKKMPEEINRMVADQLSDLLFVPTQQASINLKNEGFAENKIIFSGDVMFDAALYYGKKAKAHSHILAHLNLNMKDYILVTIHRAENTDDFTRLNNIFKALCEVAMTKKIILPLHPRTQKILESTTQYQTISKLISIIEPVGFLDMVQLEKNASMIVTDSGGVQKEAFFYQVPCVTLRDETEWVELVKLGWNHLVSPTSVEEIIKAITFAEHRKGNLQTSPYGNGDASKMIIEKLLSIEMI